jgi:hypothetical protein
MSLHTFRLTALPVLALAVLAVGGLWAIAQPAEKKVDKAPPAPQGLEIRDKLRKIAVPAFEGLDDPKVTLLEALDQFTKNYKVTFDVNEKAFKAENVPDVLKLEIASSTAIPPMRNVSAASILEKILLRVPVTSGTTFLIRKDHIEITTGQAVRHELSLEADQEAEKTSVTGLPPLVWEHLVKVPLEKALRDIAEDTGVNVVLDPRAEKQGSIEVTTTLRNVPVATAVETLAEMAGLAVVRRHNVLFVTTPENAERMVRSKRWSGELPRGTAKPGQPRGN